MVTFEMIVRTVVQGSPTTCNYAIKSIVTLNEQNRVASCHWKYLIVINVMHNCLLPNYSFIFEWIITKHGRIMKRHSETSMVVPKFWLKLFHPSSCHFYSRCHIWEVGKRLCFIVHKLLLQFSTNLRQTWKSISQQYGGWPKVLAPSPLDSFRQSGLP